MTPRFDEWQLDTEFVGRRVLVYDELPSTNSTAIERASELPGGTVIIARHQTAGRGRLGRAWHSQPDASLLLSVLLRPPAELCRPSILTAWAAVAIGDTVYALTGLQARIKWPNDLLIRSKKVSGILIEQGNTQGGDRRTTHVVAGVGLNLNQTPDQFAAADLPAATSLAIESGTPIQFRTAAETAIRRLDAEYGRLLCGERTAVEADWKWRMGLLGRTVRVELADGTSLHGRLREMGFEGIELEAEPGCSRVLIPELIAHIRSV